MHSIEERGKNTMVEVAVVTPNDKQEQTPKGLSGWEA
jgi:hypothetical protein